MSDSQVEHGIRELLKARRISGLQWFEVESRHGVATIRACVNSEFSHRTCYECCRHMPGVRYVVDRIEVMHA
ncbi:MAG: BON domain-containing protein [Planctomycetaceae bacterium]